jgi:hypothetical protein
VDSYILFIIGPSGLPEGRVDFECDSDLEAEQVAFAAHSEHGHALWRDRDFLGWFSGRPGPTQVQDADTQFELNLSDF